MFGSINWTEIYNKHSKKMLWVCKRYVDDMSLAEDLMHEGFITAMQKQHTFSGFGSFEGWLKTIMINTSLIYLRKNKKSVFISEIEIPDTIPETIDMNSVTNSKSKIINTDFTQEELLDAVASIPEHHRIVFNMYVVDNFSHSKISKTLNITTNTSKSHLLRARKKIQELLFLKASEKEQKKDRKKLFFWFFFTSLYVDSLYAASFSSFQTKPVKPFDIAEIIRINNLPVKATKGFIFRVTLQNFILSLFSIILIFLGILYFFTSKNNVTIEIDLSKAEKENKEKNKINSIEKGTLKNTFLITENDSLNQSNLEKKSKPKSNIKLENSLLNESAKSKKRKRNNVVVKKIVDTVYVYE